MVFVIGVKTLKNAKDEAFTMLVLQGGLEIVKSKLTGKNYFTSKKCSIASTFDEAVAKTFIGSKLPGIIEKAPCEPYDYIIPQTGETVELDYNYQYNPSPNSIEETVMENYEIA